MIRPAFLFLVLSTLPAMAQSAHDSHGSQTTSGLPAICQVQADPHAGHAMAPAAGSGPQSAGHQALMDSMTGMHEKMSASMAADDVDVAFVCGMIVHHQGAIDMARAELDHGDDAWAKTMAEKIVAAQEAEIKEMTDWLNAQ